MTERRTPRAHLQTSALGEEQGELPPCSPVLVEWLERQFPVALSAPGYEVVNQAEQRGRQQVIDRLRNLLSQEG